MSFRVIFAALAGLLASANASTADHLESDRIEIAQADELLNIFGGMIAAGQAQAASQAWARQPEARRYCLTRALARENVDVRNLIRSGVMPDDPRLLPLSRECQRFEPSALRTDFRCTILDERGMQAPSQCAQRFARAGQEIDSIAAIESHFSGIAIEVIEIETAQGRRERHARQEAEARRAQLSGLAQQIEPLRSSRSEVVRSRANSLLLATNRAGASGSATAQQQVQKEYAELRQFAEVEDERLSRMASLEQVKASLARRLRSDTPEEIKSEIARLDGEFAIVARAPATLATAAPSAVIVDRRTGQPLGPSFDCGRATAPLARVVCSDAYLMQLDLEMLQPFYVLRHLLPDERLRLRDEALAQTRRVITRCRIPERGQVAAAAMRQMVACAATDYRRQRDDWRAQVARLGSVPGRQEAQRSAIEHVALQERLVRSGLLATDTRVDGVYGGATRQAIAALQTQVGLPSDGLMSDATASRLLPAEAPVAMAPPLPAVDRRVLQQISDLEVSYRRLSVRLDQLDAVRSRQEQSWAALQRAKTFAQEALTHQLPPTVAAALRQFVAEADRESSGSAPEALDRINVQFDTIRPSVQGAIEVSKARTPKNAFLVEGGLNDIVILYNDSGRAPSVVRNLRGDLVFDVARTAACQPHSGLQDIQVTRRINERLAAYRLPLSFPLPRCEMARINSYDLIVLQKGLLLRERSSDLVTLLSAVDTGVYALAAELSEADVRASIDAEGVKAAEIQAQVEAGVGTGFAIAAVSNGSRVICMIVSGAREAHEATILTAERRLSEELGGKPSLVATSADGTFLSVRRSQCGAVYGSMAALKDLAAAMARDRITFRWLPLMFDEAQLQTAAASIAARQTASQQQEADRQRAAADQRRVAAARASEASAVRARAQEELRRQYGAMARAFETSLTTEMKSFLEAAAGLAPSTPTTAIFAQKYPEIVQWYAEQLAERWELVSVETVLVDYGIAEFKGRSLETAFAQHQIRLRNRILGEYKQQCFVTAFIADNEFSMDREPMAATCAEGAATSELYRTAQRFSSRWIAP